jgi:hypothetical protein
VDVIESQENLIYDEANVVLRERLLAGDDAAKVSLHEFEYKVDVLHLLLVVGDNDVLKVDDVSWCIVLLLGVGLEMREHQEFTENTLLDYEGATLSLSLTVLIQSREDADVLLDGDKFVLLTGVLG